MNQLTVYKIFTFTLLPFAVLFGFTSLFAIFIALANPALLLPVFIMVCFVIYSIASLIFLIKGINRNQFCKPSLKDWIKVNGYVCAALGGMTLANTLVLLSSKKSELKLVAEQMLATQMMKPQGVTADSLIPVITALAVALMLFSLVLLIHVFLNFRLLKKYQHIFSGGQQ